MVEVNLPVTEVVPTAQGEQHIVGELPQCVVHNNNQDVVKDEPIQEEDVPDLVDQNIGDAPEGHGHQPSQHVVIKHQVEVDGEEITKKVKSM